MRSQHRIPANRSARKPVQSGWQGVAVVREQNVSRTGAHQPWIGAASALATRWAAASTRQWSTSMVARYRRRAVSASRSHVRLSATSPLSAAHQIA